MTRFTLISLVSAVSVFAIAGCAKPAAEKTVPPEADVSETASVEGDVTRELPANAFEIKGSDGVVLIAESLGQFEEPWAMTFLPDGNLLVNEKEGRIKLVTADGDVLGQISGVPESEVAGQGGFADLALHPDFENNKKVYISYIEAEGDLYGSVVESGTLNLTSSGGELTDIERIWTQSPKVDTGRHFSQRLLFDKDGYLFITSGDRGGQTPAQDMNGNLGKLIRLNDDGSLPDDNPFAGQGGIKEQFWSIGHRNPLGIAMDADGQIWENEMGPRGGDELNRIVKGENYGWPVVSDGRNYSMLDIPDHDTRDDFKTPAISWVPSISPGSLIIYTGDVFADWKGNALMGGLSGQAIVRVSLDGEKGTEEARYSWDERVREIERGPDGAIYVLEDGFEGRLLRITPKG